MDTVRHKSQKWVLFSLILIAAAIPPCARAQEIPQGQDVGAQSKRLKEEMKQRQKELREQKTKAPEIQMEEEREVQKPAAAAAKFTLKDIKIVGATVFAPEGLRPLYESDLNAEITFQDLERIAEKIKAFYKKEGYLTTTAYVGEQEIKDGVVEIRVVEGKMGDLKIEGNKEFKSPLIENYFHTKKNEVLNFYKLQSDLIRLNQNSDLEVKTLIAAGKAPETSDIKLDIKERVPWHLGFGTDNQGSRFTGRYRTLFSLRGSNATGRFDTFFMSTLLSQGSFGESFSYTIPVNTFGTKFGIDGTYMQTEMGAEYREAEITGKTRIYTPYIVQEMYLGERFQAYASYGMDIQSVKKWIGRTILITNDQLRIPFAAMDLTWIGDGSRTNFGPRLDVSLEDLFGASRRDHPSASRDGSGGCFVKYEQSLSYSQRMPLESYIMLRSQYQIASRTLPSSEMLQLGGMNSVRGYPEGDFLCDTGGRASLVWVFPMYLLPQSLKLPGSDTALRYQIQPVIFYDVGTGHVKKVNVGEKENKLLMGAGGGLMMSFYNKLYMQLEWAESLGQEPVHDLGPATFNLKFQSEY